MPEEKEPIKIEDTQPIKEAVFPFLIYVHVELEVRAKDPEDAKAEASKLFDKLISDNKENNLRIKEAKVADPATGYFFRK